MRDARERIATRERWTRHASARDAEGRSVGPKDPGAVKWCATAAVSLAIHALKPARDGHAIEASEGWNTLAAAMHRLHPERFTEYGTKSLVSVIAGNDEKLTHEELLAGFDEAIAPQAH